VPDNPGAWITRVGRNKAIDRIRRERTLAQKSEVLARLEALEAGDRVDEPAASAEPPEIPDDRLRLIFTCCHPALAPEARIALTLRTLGGLETGEIARAFLVSESAMAQRLVRAKRKIREARIPYQVPSVDTLGERLAGVLATLYLIFNEGYLAASDEEPIRADLCAEAIRLASILVAMLPDEPEAAGLLALMLLHDSRRPARLDPEGQIVLLADQDRSLWDREQRERGLSLAARALASRRPGPYAIQAAIAAEHCRAPDAELTDWSRIRHLYDFLVRLDPSPVVRLNRAVAVAMEAGAGRGLAEIERIEGLESYHLLHSARADLLSRLGRPAEAAAAYRRAIELAPAAAERSFLEGRLADLEAKAP
jgi:RNA polymerase sigma-70 factor (ECF subfamily)